MSMYLTHQALVESFINLGLPIDISHENVDFNPLNTDPFVAIYVIPASIDSLGKRGDGSDEIAGVFQASFFAPSGESVGELLQLVDTCLQFYKHGSTVIKDTQSVYIENSERNGGRNAEGWYIIDVSVYFKADIGRV